MNDLLLFVYQNYRVKIFQEWSTILIDSVIMYGIENKTLRNPIFMTLFAEF